jgi:aldehyde dehydrogenase (NAD+)
MCHLAARRIVFGKFMNSGQTCVAPDYCYVHESKKEELVGHMVEAIKEFYTEDRWQALFFPHMINEKHFERVKGLFRDEHILYAAVATPWR